MDKIHGRTPVVPIVALTVAGSFKFEYQKFFAILFEILELTR